MQTRKAIPLNSPVRVLPGKKPGSALPTPLILVLGFVIGIFGEQLGAHLLSPQAFKARLGLVSGATETEKKTERETSEAEASLPLKRLAFALSKQLKEKNSISPVGLINDGEAGLGSHLPLFEFEQSLSNGQERAFYLSAWEVARKNPEIKGLDLSEKVQVSEFRSTLEEMKQRLEDARDQGHVSVKEIATLNDGREAITALLDKGTLSYPDLIRAALIYAWCTTPEAVLGQIPDAARYNPLGESNVLFEAMMSSGVEASQSPNIWYLPTFRSVSISELGSAAGLGLAHLRLFQPFKTIQADGETFFAFTFLQHEFAKWEKIGSDLLAPSKLPGTDLTAKRDASHEMRGRFSLMHQNWVRQIELNDELSESNRRLLQVIFLDLIAKRPQEFLFALTSDPHARDLEDMESHIKNSADYGQFFYGLEKPSTADIRDSLKIVRSFFLTHRDAFTNLLTPAAGPVKTE